MDGDNAIFNLYRVENGREKEYMTVVLTDMDKQADGSRLKNITLVDDGVWKIVETDWSWTFEFINAPKTDTPQYGESIKINKIK